MPASPELGRTLGGVGIVEVPRIIEPHHLAQADGHVRIAREVEVDLEGVGSYAREATNEANFGGTARQKGVGEDACRISEQHLLSQADAEEPQTLGEASECGFAVVDLVFDVGIPNDGARDELWKHCDIHAEVQRVFLRIYFAAIDIDDVGDCLQGEKRNADWQCKIELGYELLADSAVDVMCEKALVLVETKDGDIESKVKDEQELFACCLSAS